MPKASVVLADGTKVTIDGTVDEVAAVLERIAGDTPLSSGRGGGPKKSGSRRAKATAKVSTSRRAALGPADYIRELAADGFFKTKRGLGDVQKKLEEGAHIYPVTNLSPTLYRLVKSKELRRVKEGGTWKYVNP